MTLSDFFARYGLIALGLTFSFMNTYKLWEEHDDVRVFKRGINVLSYLLICILIMLNSMRISL